jgi:hypothetical protein
MFRHDDNPTPKKHITTGDIIWTITCICAGFLLIYIFYLLFTSLTGSTLYREILHR